MPQANFHSTGRKRADDSAARAKRKALERETERRRLKILEEKLNKAIALLRERAAEMQESKAGYDKAAMEAIEEAGKPNPDKSVIVAGGKAVGNRVSMLESVVKEISNAIQMQIALHGIEKTENLAVSRAGFLEELGLRKSQLQKMRGKAGQGVGK